MIPTPASISADPAAPDPDPGSENSTSSHAPTAYHEPPHEPPAHAAPARPHPSAASTGDVRLRSCGASGSEREPVNPASAPISAHKRAEPSSGSINRSPARMTGTVNPPPAAPHAVPTAPNRRVGFKRPFPLSAPTI